MWKWNHKKWKTKTYLNNKEKMENLNLKDKNQKWKTKTYLNNKEKKENLNLKDKNQKWKTKTKYNKLGLSCAKLSKAQVS